MEPVYQVVLTPGAQTDLRNIYDYLLAEASVDTAERVRLGIEEEIIALATLPQAKGLLKGTTSKTIYRRVLKWSYRIIFTIEEAELRVLVVRIDHQKRNPAALENLP